MKFGFIGTGNMGSAIIRGMTLGTKSYDGSSIYVTDKMIDSANRLEKECSVIVCQTTEEVINECDILILSVKPHILQEVLPLYKDTIHKKGILVVSIAAGKTIEYLENLLNKDIPIIRIMPNINAKIGASTSGLCSNNSATREHKDAVISMFKTIGSVIELDESLFAIFSVIAGAAPAFAYLYMDSLARAALKAGMPKKQALEIVAQTVLGSAKMILNSDEHPFSLIDQVCSPGGTTIEGVCTLQENGFENTLCKAFDAVLDKDKNIGK